MSNNSGNNSAKNAQSPLSASTIAANQRRIDGIDWPFCTSVDAEGKVVVGGYFMGLLPGNSKEALICAAPDGRIVQVKRGTIRIAARFGNSS